MGAPGKRMRLGTKSCAECRRRKVRCIIPPGQDRCDACQAHGSSCVPQEKQLDGDASPVSGTDDVAALKKRLDELETLMRGLPGDMLNRSVSVHDAGLTDGSTAASASPSLTDGRSPSSIGTTFQQQQQQQQDQQQSPIYSSLVDTAHIVPAFQNSPLISLFNESSIFDPITHTHTVPGPLTPTASSRLRQCLAQFASYLPRPERVVKLFEGTQQYWSIWPPYFYGPGDADCLGPGQVPLAEKTFHNALVSGHPGQTAKAILFLSLCIQQTPKRLIQSLIPPSIQQQELVDTYIETAQTLLLLDTEAAGGTLDSVEGMNMLYKLCINSGRPQRAWSWNRQAITASLSCGLPSKVTRAGERSAQAWAIAWRAERFMAMTLGLPSSTSALHPGLEPLQDENTVMAIMYYVAVVCGKIIDRDQSRGGGRSHYATTIQLGEDIEDAKRQLFPAQWWTDGHLSPDLDQAAGWYQQSTKIIFLTALKVAHLPYMLRAATDRRYGPSWDAAMGAARDICVAYCDFRHWPKGGAELCQVMDFRAFSAALVLVLGHLVAPAQSQLAAAEADAARVRDVALCLRQTAAMMDCRVAEQAVRTLDVLDAAQRGVYMAEDDYEVMVPYFGKIRVNKAFFRPQEQQLQQAQQAQQQLQQKPEDAVSDHFNTVEFNTNDFLVEFPVDMGEAAELCCDWAELGLGYGSMDWGHSFTCGPFFDTEGAGAT